MAGEGLRALSRGQSLLGPGNMAWWHGETTPGTTGDVEVSLGHTALKPLMPASQKAITKDGIWGRWGPTAIHSEGSAWGRDRWPV